MDISAKPLCFTLRCVVGVGNADACGTSRYEKTTPVERVAHEWCACNSVTPVRDQTVGRRAAYLYTLRARRPVERRRSCRVVSHREEPKARSALPPPPSLPPPPVRPRRQLHLPRAAAPVVTWDVAADGDGSLSSLPRCQQLSSTASGGRMLRSLGIRRYRSWNLYLVHCPAHRLHRQPWLIKADQRFPAPRWITLPQFRTRLYM